MAGDVTFRSVCEGIPVESTKIIQLQPQYASTSCRHASRPREN